MDKGPKPLEFPELAEMANTSLIASWDRDQPIRRYVAATRQLLRESKVYRNEGDYDKAFVFSIKIHTLTSKLLPKEHPQWSKLPIAEKRAIQKEADQITYQINDLKGLIQDRNDAWARGVPVRVPTPARTPRPPSPTTAPRRQPSPAPSTSSAHSTSSRATSVTTAPGSSVALTLQNTVQPAQMSMSSNVPAATTPLTPKYPAKENRATKWKRKLGIVKELPVGAGYLAEPGVGIDEAPEEEDEKGWTMLPGPNSRHANGPGVQGPGQDPRLNQAGYGYSAQRARDVAMPLPGEDDEDDVEAEGIVFQAGPSAQREWTPQMSNAPINRPPSASSGPNPSQQYASPPPPNAPQHQQTSFAPWSGGQAMPQPNPYSTQPLYSQQAPPPQQQQQQQQQQLSMAWPSSSYPTAPPSHLPPPPSNMGNGLVRSPSRLTTSHQQQQGYSPSHFATVPTSRMPLPTVQGMPVTTWNAASAPGGNGPPLHPHSVHSGHHHAQYARLPPIVPPPPRVPPYPSSSSAPVTPINPNPHSNAPRPTSLSRPASNTSLAAPPTLLPSAPPAIPAAPVAPRQLTRTTSMSMAAIPAGLIQPRNRPSKDISSFQVDGLAGLKVASVVEEEAHDDELTKTEGGQPLRNMRLPMELISSFIKSASANTNKGVETCGLLMGNLSHNTFTISTLLIPKQVGTTDTCTTTHEEEQFEFQDKRDLMTLGWIHTHPTQSCFMSSLDLHTHSSYQLMLAEAIAIVCAPKHEPSFGIFRLTDPPGLETIVKCTAPGAFHPHPDLPIYTDTDHGHVQLRNKLPFENVDLRAK